MQPSTPGSGILSEAPCIRDTKLLSQMVCDTAWDSGRLIQKRAQETHRTELDGKPKPHVVPTLCASQFAIGVIQMEVPRELIRARFAGVAAVSPFLLGRQERDWHPFRREV
jgi:hypothetical protein